MQQGVDAPLENLYNLQDIGMYVIEDYTKKNAEIDKKCCVIKKQNTV